MNILFFGSSHFSTYTLNKIQEDKNISCHLVVTKKDKKRNNKNLENIVSKQANKENLETLKIRSLKKNPRNNK